ncbi:MAG: acetyl-CoA carboxylase, carboxyltransferase subunit beta [Anaerorhabdus sp.]
MENLFKKRQERIAQFEAIRKKDIHKVNKVKEVPDNLVIQCPKCKETKPYFEIRLNRYVCTSCNEHFKISARERIRQLTDLNSFIESDKYATTYNSDNFIGYSKKLEQYQKKTGLQEAVICGVAKIDSKKLAIAIMDSNFMMGSMGSVVGDKITRLIEYATKEKLPLLISCTSGGARMQEGIISLMQMAKTSAAIKRHSEKGLLYISLLTHPTTGGVSASFAMLADLILAEPNALIGFAGKRVIEKTINEVLPENFQSAEFMLEKGFIDAIVDRRDARETISKIMDLHGVKS